MSKINLLRDEREFILEEKEVMEIYYINLNNYINNGCFVNKLNRKTDSNGRDLMTRLEEYAPATELNRVYSYLQVSFIINKSY